MSTHNIGFYEEIIKIITKLSSNIKYAPYFFCWYDNVNKPMQIIAYFTAVKVLLHVYREESQQLPFTKFIPSRNLTM